MQPRTTPAVAHWDFPRGLAGLRVLVAFGADHGVPAADLFAAAGVPADADPATEVSAHQELAVVRVLAGALPDAGLAVGRRYHVTTFGMLGYAVLSSGTFGAAVDVTMRYLDLSFIFCLPRLSFAGDQVRLAVDDSALPADLARFLVERDLAAIRTVVGELRPGGVPLTEVAFRFPEPADVAPYVELFGVRPVFGAAATSVAFAAAELASPLPQADPVTVADCEARCQALVQSRRRRTGVTGAVRAEFARVGGIGLGMAEVAARLAVSERTLRRRLAESGSSFRDLRDEVRCALAEELLADGALPVAAIAVRLGYAESASFIHAFQRWKGVSPAGHAAARSGELRRRVR